MRSYSDRTPVNPGRRKLTYENGSSEFVTVEMADNPTAEGTPLNREMFMALQGFESLNTEFLEDGSVVETNKNGDVLTTTFPEDSISLETFVPADGGTKLSLRTYEENGTIKEEVLTYEGEEV